MFKGSKNYQTLLAGETNIVVLDEAILGEEKSYPKPVLSEAALFNNKAMNAIFNAVCMEEFKRISNVEIALTAWNIL